MRNATLLAFAVLCSAVSVGAQSWNACGLPNAGGHLADIESVHAFAAHSGALYAANTTGKLMKSTNGSTWTPIPLDGVEGTVSVITSAGSRLYIATFVPTFANGSIYYTTNDGATWTVDTTGVPDHVFGTGKAFVRRMHYWHHHLAVTFDQADAYYIRHVEAEQWTRNDYLAQNDPHAYASIGDRLFVASNKLRYTDDFGGNWTEPANSGLPAWFIAKNLTIDGTRLYMTGTVVTGSVPDTLYYSDDLGESWAKTAATDYLGASWLGQTQRIGAMFARNNSIWLASTNDARNTTPDILRSSNGGSTFVKDTLGLPPDPNGTNTVGQFVYHNGMLYAALLFRDVYRQQTDGVTSVEEHPTGPDVVLVPNPAHERVELRGFDPSAYERIALYDIHGRVVLVVPPASDIHIGSLPAGMYTIEATGRHPLRRFMLKQ